jgi:hypothetical protein
MATPLSTTTLQGRGGSVSGLLKVSLFIFAVTKNWTKEQKRDEKKRRKKWSSSVSQNFLAVPLTGARRYKSLRPLALRKLEHSINCRHNLFYFFKLYSVPLFLKKTQNDAF